jgi:hypothetical protein
MPGEVTSTYYEDTEVELVAQAEDGITLSSGLAL